MTKRTYKTKLYAFQRIKTNQYSSFEKTVALKSSISKPSSKLFETIGKISFKLTDTNWHLKDLKCECKIHPLAPSSLSLSDSKTFRVNCNKKN
jgi:hypothetical protein